MIVIPAPRVTAGNPAEHLIDQAVTFLTGQDHQTATAEAIADGIDAGALGTLVILSREAARTDGRVQVASSGQFTLGRAA